MKKVYYIGYFWLCLMVFSESLYGQDIEKIAQDVKKLSVKKLVPDTYVSLSGNISLQHLFYSAWEIENRQVPFNYNYSGNLNMNVLGKVNIPISFNYINQNATFNQGFTEAINGIWNRRPRFIQPFNRLTLRPTYKGLSVQIGTCALNFSPYTLANHRYEGVGVEYKGKKIPLYGSIMVGNLQRAIPIDTSLRAISNIPSYKRQGLGAKVGYRHEKDKIELIFFTAKDIYSPDFNLDLRRISPQANAVVSLNVAKMIKSKLSFNGAFAISGLTLDQRAQNRANSFLRTFGGVLTQNISTTYRNAIKVGLDYQGKTFKLGTEYSRVDPDYRTLGAYFFNNDLETYSIKAAFQLLKGKLSLMTNGGLQQDNLYKRKFQTLRRFVGAINTNYQPTEKTNILLSYSSFTSYSNLQPAFYYLTRITPYNALDTLDYRQINQNIMSSVSHSLPSSNPKTLQKNISFDIIWQGNKSELGSTNQGNQLLNISSGYNYNNTEQKLSWNINFIYSRSILGYIKDNFIGPSVGGNKTWGSLKMQGMVSMSLAKTQQTDILSVSKNTILNTRLGINYTLAKKHNFILTTIFLKRSEPKSDRYMRNFSELTTTIGYSLSFTALELKKKQANKIP